MIPWQTFNLRAGSWDLDFPLELHEEYLHLVERGPSMADFVLESPMLELAHERQFVVTQQGGDSATFEDEHTVRIGSCLEVLDQYFRQYGSDVPYHAPRSPPMVDSTGLWLTTKPIEEPVTLDLDSADLSWPTDVESGCAPQQGSLQMPPVRSDEIVPTKLHDIDEVHVSDNESRDRSPSLIPPPFLRSGQLKREGTSRTRKPIKLRRRSAPRTALESDQYHKALHYSHTVPSPAEPTSPAVPGWSSGARRLASPAPQRGTHGCVDQT